MQIIITSWKQQSEEFTCYSVESSKVNGLTLSVVYFDQRMHAHGQKR